ncbi:MAG: dihydroorotase [Bradymonadia bacterium]|jgi:dihydroorotase
MGNITFRDAEMVLPTGVVRGDLSIVDGKIAEIGTVTDPRGEIIDAKGLTLMPGVIDPQVHFREPGSAHKEDLESGSIAAAAGGVTSFLDMPNNDPPMVTIDSLHAKIALCVDRCRSNFGFFFGATPGNATEVGKLDPSTVPGLKIFMGASHGDLLVHEQEALEALFAASPVPVVVHAEDEMRLRARYAEAGELTDASQHPIIRDETAALMATQRAVALAEKHSTRLHVLHLSTAEETEFLRARTDDGLVTTETLPQYLWLDASMYSELGTHLQMNPPVRAKRHQEALWAGLYDGTIACIATDHAPHTLEEKAQPFGKAPSGMPGVELSLPLMLHAVHSGRCSIEQVVRWMCAAPAEIYGIVGKGRLEVGMDGDVVLVDRKARGAVRNGRLKTRVNWSPFDGWHLRGWPVMTVIHGDPVFRDGEIQPGVYGTPLRFEAPEKVYRSRV